MADSPGEVKEPKEAKEPKGDRRGANIRVQLHFGYLGAFMALFIIEVGIALFVRDAFVRPYLGDVLAVILVYCLLRGFLTQPGSLLPIFVFLFAVTLEVLQYIDMLSLLGLADWQILRIVLGGTFDGKDILCYLAGTLLLVLWQERPTKGKRVTNHHKKPPIC